MCAQLANGKNFNSANHVLKNIHIQRFINNTILLHIYFYSQQTQVLTYRKSMIEDFRVEGVAKVIQFSLKHWN